MKAFQLVLMLLLLAVLGQASLLNWVLGRNPLDSDKNFDKLVQSVPSEVDPPVQEVVDHDQTGVAAPSSIKFELTSVDEKFIADAKKFADLQLSELDVCQHKLILQLKTDCNDLTEEQLSKLGVNLLNCQSSLEGRPIYPCSNSMTLKECTSGMDSDTWNAYHIMSNRARSVCYASRQQQFRALTQMTVNRLMASTSEQLDFIQELKEEQKELGSLATETLGRLSKSQNELMERQDQLKVSQELASRHIDQTMKEVTRERVAALTAQRHATVLSKTLQATLNRAAVMVQQQDSERQEAQQRLMESLHGVEGRIGDVWSQLEHSVQQLVQRQNQAVHLQTETVQALERLNATFQFLVGVSERSQERLDWIQGLVGSTEKRLGKVSTWLIHVGQFLLGMLLLSFLQAPSYTRCAFLVLVPINLAMDLQQGFVLELPALVTLLLAVSMVCRVVQSLRRRCESTQAAAARPAISCGPLRTSSASSSSRSQSTVLPKELVEDLVCNFSTVIDDSILAGSDSLLSRSSTPLPTLDSFRSNLSHGTAPPTMRSLLQERLDLDESRASSASLGPADSTMTRSALRDRRFELDDSTASCASSLYRRSSRLASTNASVLHDASPARTPAKSATPRRPGTPSRRNCAGQRVDGTNCRNAASKDSDFCWQHK